MVYGREGSSSHSHADIAIDANVDIDATPQPPIPNPTHPPPSFMPAIVHAWSMIHIDMSGTIAATIVARGRRLKQLRHGCTVPLMPDNKNRQHCNRHWTTLPTTLDQLWHQPACQMDSTTDSQRLWQRFPEGPALTQKTSPQRTMCVPSRARPQGTQVGVGLHV